MRLQYLHNKENFKPEIKPKIENLQDELCQLENKQKVLNFVLTLEAGGQEMPHNFLQVLETENMQNQRIFELYTDNNKSKYSSNPKDILKSGKKKKIMKNSTPSELSQLLLLNFFGQFLTERKYLMNILIFVRLKYL